MGVAEEEQSGKGSEGLSEQKMAKKFPQESIHKSVRNSDSPKDKYKEIHTDRRYHQTVQRQKQRRGS